MNYSIRLTWIIHESRLMHLQEAVREAVFISMFTYSIHLK